MPRSFSAPLVADLAGVAVDPARPGAEAELPGAIAAGGVAYNLSRTSGLRLRLCDCQFRPVDAVLDAGRRQSRRDRGPAVVSGADEGNGGPARRAPHRRRRTWLRHAANNRLLRATMLRSLAVYPFAAAYWGLFAPDRAADRQATARSTTAPLEHDQRRSDLRVVRAAVPAGADRPRLDGRPGDARHRRGARPVRLDA